MGSEVVLLLLSLPGLELAQAVAGVVRWIRPPSDAHDASPGMGVQLIDPPSDVTAAIAAYAATREPVFYD